MASVKKYNDNWPNLRFVVGSFATVDQASGAVADLLNHDVPCDSVGILAKQELLSRDARKSAALDGDAAAPVEFDLLTSREGAVLCFGRTLGELLRSRVSEGSKTLTEAFQRWLLPRHAGSLSDVVENDGILIWVEIHNPEEERNASLSLLRNSRGTVEVHDFVT